MKEAVTRLGPAVAALEQGEPDAEVAEAAAQLARFLALNGEYAEAAPHVERALDLAERLELPETLSQALNTKSVMLLRTGRHQEARLLLDGALALAIAKDLQSAALRAYNNRVVLAVTSDNPEEAIAFQERGIELARRAGHPLQEATFMASMVQPLAELGRWDEALVRIAEAEERGTTEFGMGFLVAAGEILIARGAVDEWHGVLERLASIERSQNPDLMGWWALGEATRELAAGRPREALTAARRGLAEYYRTGSGPWKANLLASLEAAAVIGPDELSEQLADVEALPKSKRTPSVCAQQLRFRARLERERAEELYGEAERIFAELGRPFRLAVVRLEHAEWLVGEGRSDDAEPLLAEARTTFEQLRATPWFERAASREPARA